MGKVYISGPITNNPDYRKQFNDKAAELDAKGYEVINPGNLIDVMKNGSYTDYMFICINLLTLADTIYMLDGWENSKGACIEYEYAIKNNYTIIKRL